MRPQRPSRGATPKAAWFGCIPWVAIFTLAVVGGVCRDRSPVSLLPNRCAYRRAARTSKPRPLPRPALALRRAAPPRNRTSSTASGGRGWTSSRSALRSARATADHRRRRQTRRAASRLQDDDPRAAAARAGARQRPFHRRGEARLWSKDHKSAETRDPGLAVDRPREDPRPQVCPVHTHHLGRHDEPALPPVRVENVRARDAPLAVEEARRALETLREHQPKRDAQLLRFLGFFSGGGFSRRVGHVGAAHVPEPQGREGPAQPETKIPPLPRDCAVWKSIQLLFLPERTQI